MEQRTVKDFSQALSDQVFYNSRNTYQNTEGWNEWTVEAVVLTVPSGERVPRCSTWAVADALCIKNGVSVASWRPFLRLRVLRGEGRSCSECGCWYSIWVRCRIVWQWGMCTCLSRILTSGLISPTYGTLWSNLTRYITQVTTYTLRPLHLYRDSA